MSTNHNQKRVVEDELLNADEVMALFPLSGKNLHCVINGISNEGLFKVTMIYRDETYEVTKETVIQALANLA